ncbi:uncharacterized protein P884DRAFT_261618 [Thermothelomyces heterothallicus CBS 202.75]|uniref:uncharacterized protein n=1 Tax=Thermothelomyces heterothallicus CBS 202.75 TaxID=1149848 RepID=UPI0037438CC1
MVHMEPVRMPKKLSITPWHRQPPGPASHSACSPSGRPYSPYPYRDLPKTPGEQHLSRALTKTAPASPTRDATFHLFPLLPTELRLQIWREAMLAACAASRVHRVRLAITYHTVSDDGELASPTAATTPTTATKRTVPTLQIHRTAHLAASTFATRALLSSCSEARHELLRPGIVSNFLPDTLPVYFHPRPHDRRSGGMQGPSTSSRGVVRLDLARDILLLDSLSADLLLQLADARYFEPGLLDPLQGVRRLGLDVGGLMSPPDTEGGDDGSRGIGDGDGDGDGGADLSEGAVVPPMVEMALVRLVGLMGGDRGLEAVYLLGESAWVGGDRDEQKPGAMSPVQGKEQGHLFLGGEGESEWYSTRPFPSYYVDSGYHARLARLIRLLCQLRQAMDAPAVVTDLDDEEVLERLEETKLRVLGHYYIVQPGSGRPEGLQLSCPELCLEAALGREPRWVQWEWVCQCLDC